MNILVLLNNILSDLVIINLGVSHTISNICFKESETRYMKNDVSRNIADVIKYANFQLYKVYPPGVVWEYRLLMTNYVNIRIRLVSTSY